MNLTCMNPPDVTTVIFYEVSLHLEDFFASDSLQIVAHLEALHVTVLLKLAFFKQLKLVFILVALIVDFFFNFFWIEVEWCSELDHNVVIVRVLGRSHRRLNVVDHSGLH